ncbi:DUF5983 family protein [Paenibacillus sp. FSL P4-0288]|uniref:DUF5983 family protein n=1 Tax=Paenibacillus sp. FSL P4-0288 TaxID=2921633 RepID=UPI0030F6CA8D
MNKKIEVMKSVDLEKGILAKAIKESMKEASLKSSPGIVKILELSTANIEEKTSQWLLEDPISLNVHQKGEEGFFILVQDNEDNVKLPQDLQIIMEYASKLDCTWIIMDRDYSENYEIPIYEWSE